MTVEASSPHDPLFAAEVVERARAWIGTPYCHQASCKGAGTDCLGLLLGIWREMIGREPEEIPAYSSDWSEMGREESLLQAAMRHMIPVPIREKRPGDVLIMRMRRDGIAKHIGILAESSLGNMTMIHAYSGHGVVESPLTPAWAARAAGVFRFPIRSN